MTKHDQKQAHGSNRGGKREIRYIPNGPYADALRERVMTTNKEAMEILKDR